MATVLGLLASFTAYRVSVERGKLIENPVAAPRPGGYS